jgi:hypothetical protein
MQIPLWVSTQLSFLVFVLAAWYIYFYLGHLDTIKRVVLTTSQRPKKQQQQYEIESYDAYHMDMQHQQQQQLHYYTNTRDSVRQQQQYQQFSRPTSSPVQHQRPPMTSPYPPHLRQSYPTTTTPTTVPPHRHPQQQQPYVSPLLRNYF